MENSKKATTLPLHTHKLHPLTTFNRLYMVVYATALALLFYHETRTLFNSSSTLSFIFSILLLFSHIVFTFIWTTTQSFRVRPVLRREFPENLENIISKEGKEYPGLDIFICTADPYKEPPMGTVNTALSVMAYDYPPEKMSIYVSDDGGSQITLFALMEASKFARHWLPFCRENNVVDRCPEAYFNGAFYTNSSLHAHKIKTMYENMKVRVESALEKGRVEEEYIDDVEMQQVFAKWNIHNFTQRVHPTIIQVLIESTKEKDVSGELMPNLIYASREKSKTHKHGFKAGALNVLVRISATMTNAPFILTLDCDMYSNDPKSVKRALCYFFDPKIRPNLAFVQYPQNFRGLNTTDIYNGEYKRFLYNTFGMDGLLGPNYMGTGSFFQRRAFFGSPSSYIQPDIPELSPNHVVNKPIGSKEILRLSYRVAACDYENLTAWGTKISDPWFVLYIILFIGAYGKDLLDFLLEKETFAKWWNSQRMWMILGLSSFLFGCIDFILTSLRISVRGFDVTSKVHDDERSKRYDQGTFEFGVASPMFVPMSMAALINLFSFIKGSFGVISRGLDNMEGLILQIMLSGFVVINCWPIYEAMFFRRDTGRMPTKITLIAVFLATILCFIVLGCGLS